MLTLNILQDELYDGDPRKDQDNLGTIVAWHRHYRWDEQPRESPGEWLAAHPPADNLILPVFLFDHSGLRISIHPFSCPWDSGQVGFIFVSKETALKECGGPDPLKTALRCLESEIEELDCTYRGEVYCYTITDESGRILDACYGFIGERKDCGVEEAGASALAYWTSVEETELAATQAREVGLD